MFKPDPPLDRHQLPVLVIHGADWDQTSRDIEAGYDDALRLADVITRPLKNPLKT
jgi:hypothetical protein